MEPTCVDTSLNLNVVPSRDTHAAGEVVVEELQRLSRENKRLTERLNQMCENYVALQKQLSQFSPTNNNFDTELATTPISRKRKAEAESTAGTDNCVNLFGVNSTGHAPECSTTTATTEEETIFKRPKHNTSPKISKVLVRIDASDTSLYVRDGYQWRKYGQKVTRDNPSPRAYFKCSFAPTCPVKKKVQRSVEDCTVLVATYEGEHNHEQHQAAEIISLSNSSSCQISETAATGSVVVPAISSPCSSSRTGPTSTALDLVQPSQNSSSIQQFLVRQMATSLTRDPNFTAALAAAISGRFQF